jgi:hypothetical protein
MARCAACGETILFGGAKQGELRFCNSICLNKGQALAAAQASAAAVPEHVAQALARELHQSNCPKCKGPGPVDVHTSYWVWSALAMTRWGTQQQLKCRSCAVKSQVGNLFFSGVLGWWGLPWGLLLTPVQVGRNFIAIFTPPDPSQPSPKLLQVARVQIASQGK